jgi:hypothetical protein
MTNTSPSLLSSDDATQAARNTPPPLPPPQPGEPTRQSEQQRRLPAKLRCDNDDYGNFTEVAHRGFTRPMILDQQLAAVTNVSAPRVGTHVTPTRPAAPPEAASQAA